MFHSWKPSLISISIWISVIEQGQVPKLLRNHYTEYGFDKKSLSINSCWHKHNWKKSVGKVNFTFVGFWICLLIFFESMSLFGYWIMLNSEKNWISQKRDYRCKLVFQKADKFPSDYKWHWDYYFWYFNLCYKFQLYRK